MASRDRDLFEYFGGTEKAAAFLTARRRNQAEKLGTE
jgi:hypothetical protein